jgi:hypothetical protein
MTILPRLMSAMADSMLSKIFFIRRIHFSRAVEKVTSIVSGQCG